MSSAEARVNPVARPAPPGIPKIPFAFRADPIALDGLKLPRTARDVFVLLLDNAKARGWRSKLSNGTLARVLGCCPMTVKRALADLEAAGLILREFAAAGRVRIGIVVTWEGVEHSRSTDVRTVEHPRSTGGTSVVRGVEQSRSTNQSSGQNDDQSAVFIPPGKDPGEVPDPAEAARFLRAMIQAGRRGGGYSTPTTSAPPRGGYSTTPPVPLADRSPAPVLTDLSKPPAKGLIANEIPKGGHKTDGLADRVDIGDTIGRGGHGVATSAGAVATSSPPPSRPRQDDPRREVARMIDSLAFDIATGRPGRSRLSPVQLQRQLAEVRRRYGNRSASGGG